jgi:hypothetical protein
MGLRAGRSLEIKTSDLVHAFPVYTEIIVACPRSGAKVDPFSLIIE